MNYEILKLETTGGVSTITISRPQAMNALNSQFFREMDAMLDQLNRDDATRVIIITGEGKAFVAGADIAEMVNKTQSEGEEFSQIGQNTFRNMELSPKPVIAAVNGFALGGGCELAMACDIRIASAKAKFGQPEVNLGLIPGYAGTQRLPRQVGLGNALKLLFSGEMISAQEALRIGLVQQVVEPDQLMDAVRELAQNIISKGPGAIQLVKQVAREGLLAGFDRGCALEAEKFGSLFENEGKEGMKAFLEKRPPQWKK